MIKSLYLPVDTRITARMPVSALETDCSYRLEHRSRQRTVASVAAVAFTSTEGTPAAAQV